MPVDPWATTTAQEFPAQEPDVFRRLWGIIAAQKREMFDLRASVLANVSDIVADLQAKQATLAAQNVTILAQQATLAATVADLASRVTQTVSIGTFNTGSLPNDSLWHDYGASIPITIAVPTGKLVVSVGCGQATLNSGGGGSVIAAAKFSISGGGTGYSSAYLTSANTGIGTPLVTQQEFAVTPGTYTITGQMRAWAAGSTTCSAEFQVPYLTVQVTG